MRLLCLLPLILIACQHAGTSQKDSVNTGRTVCKKRDVKIDAKATDERAVEILPFEKNGCHVQYTKYSTAKSIAKAQSEKSFCSKVKDRIVTNLTNSGFVCE